MKNIISVVVLIVLIVLFLGLAAPLLNKIDFWSRIGLTKSKKQQVSVFTELLEQRNISQLEVASYYKELIFPYDFVTDSYPESAYEWERLRYRVEGGFDTPQGVVRDADAMQNLSAAQKERFNKLSEDEQKNYLFYYGVRYAWINFADNNSSYVDVNNPMEYIFRIKASASAGYDLSEENWLTYSQKEQLVTINLPDPKLLNLSIVVETGGAWPDLVMRPQEFGKLISFLEEKYIIQMMMEGEEYGLSRIAEETGQRLIESMIPKNIKVVFN